ncbi:MAG: hypothetical protein E7269_01515 [Lachnospiraceae bacterium]|nr:hypothetical protein [Lachnospiraceae bacterium]
MRETWKTLLKIHCVTILMTLCGGAGGMLGAAYCTAVFRKRTKGFLGLALSVVTAFLAADVLNGIQYTGVLAIMAAFTVLGRMLGLKEYRYIYVAVGMLLMQLPEQLLAKWDLRQMGFIIFWAAATGVTAYFFEKAVTALLDGQMAFLTQQSDAMLSAAWLIGAVTYAVIGNFSLPFLVTESLICIALLYMGYKFGAAMGGVTGAAIGVVISFSQGSMEYLGVLCFLGLLTGLFKELGRLGGVLAMLAGGAGLIFCGVEFLAQPGWLLGIVAAATLWFCYDIFTKYQRKDEPDGQWAGDAEIEKNNVQKVTETLEQIALQCLEQTRNGFEPEEDLLVDLQKRLQATKEKNQEYGREDLLDVLRLNRLWQMKCLESKETIALQLKETARLIEQLCAPQATWIELGKSAEETLRKQFLNLRVEAGKMRQKLHEDGRMELQFTWKVRAMSEKQSACVMVKELVPILNDYFGRSFQAFEANKSLIGKEAASYRFAEVPNFQVLHGSAMAKKEAEELSGDTFGITPVRAGQIVFSLADGMGTGSEARRDSNRTLEQLEQFLASGFPEEMSLRLLNTLQISSGEEQGASLDFGVLNLNSGICHLVKAGGAATFIRRNQWVEMIQGKTLPMGMLPGEHFEESTKKLYDGDMIFLVSDGFVQAFPGEEKEMEISRFLMEEPEANPKEMAHKMMQKALSYGRKDDDMSVLAIGIYQKAG